ncbi:MAG: helix-turn-helix domain-containing protein [Planctomycetes bacterium]|nr:helix-turn-helix domain-containing protein [Planctomycetota bacterium]
MRPTTRAPAALSADPVLLTSEDLTRLLQVSKTTLYSLRQRAGFPAPVKIGRSIRWPRHSVEDWIREGCPSVARASR